jgi:hypothetical protein
VHALAVPSFDLSGESGLDAARGAMERHVLDEGEWVGTYTLNPSLPSGRADGPGAGGRRFAIASLYGAGVASPDEWRHISGSGADRPRRLPLTQKRGQTKEHGAGSAGRIAGGRCERSR